MKFKTTEIQDYLLIEFEIEGGTMAPEDLKGLRNDSPKPKPNMGVVLSGRGPTWLYAHLTHRYHPVRWVGIYDPRLGGAVVVATHTVVPGRLDGDIIRMEGVIA
mgnify:CR=1 FL=1